MEHTILVVEDEQGIREAIGIYMKNQGYNVILAANGKEGLEKIETNDIHLAIVDIMMPVMDGISMVMEARKHHDFPILFLSAKSEDIDKITGLNIGADDYITKPFQSMELVARVRSHLRRYEQILNLKNETKNEDEYMIGDLVLNNTTKRVTLNSRDIKLTPKEFDILKLIFSLRWRYLVWTVPLQLCRLLRSVPVQYPVSASRVPAVPWYCAYPYLPHDPESYLRHWCCW